MIHLYKRLKFELWYLRRPPWDTHISPPELLEFIQTHPPGKAIDLGCGTGTNVVSLLQAGWRVRGVDFSWLAVQKARRKVRSLGLQADLAVADVSDISASHGPYDLVLDIGCYHQLTTLQRETYRANLERLLAPQGTYMLYAHWRSPREKFDHGIAEQDLELLAQVLRLEKRVDGTETHRGPSVWVWYRKRS